MKGRTELILAVLVILLVIFLMLSREEPWLLERVKGLIDYVKSWMGV